MSETRPIFCCTCGEHVRANLVAGADIYGNRKDLARIPMWQCPRCQNYVGCHHKTKSPTEPLGSIPGPALRDARKHIHKLIDPVWRDGRIGRSDLYKKISEALGHEFHVARISTIAEARRAYSVARKAIGDIE